MFPQLFTIELQNHKWECCTAQRFGPYEDFSYHTEWVGFRFWDPINIDKQNYTHIHRENH